MLQCVASPARRVSPFSCHVLKICRTILEVSPGTMTHLSSNENKVTLSSPYREQRLPHRKHLLEKCFRISGQMCYRYLPRLASAIRKWVSGRYDAVISNSQPYFRMLHRMPHSVYKPTQWSRVASMISLLNANGVLLFQNFFEDLLQVGVSGSTRKVAMAFIVSASSCLFMKQQKRFLYLDLWNGTADDSSTAFMVMRKLMGQLSQSTLTAPSPRSSVISHLDVTTIGLQIGTNSIQ